MKASIKHKIDYINISLLKTIAFPLLFIFFSNTSTAQLSQYIVNQDDTQTLYDIKAGMDIYINNLATTLDSAIFYAEGGEYIEYMKFMNYWEPRLHPHGDFTKVFDANNAFYTQNQNNFQHFTDEPWHEVGPFDRPGGESDGVGPVEYLSIFDNGTPESTRYMLVASLLGGVFYSTDYGENWSSTSTDTQWELSGSGCAIFSPTDHTTWYASSSGNSNSGFSSWIGQTGGIYRTTDEGQTWFKIADYNDFGSVWIKIFKLMIVEGTPNTLFAITSYGIFKSDDFEINEYPTWDRIFDNFAYDMEIKPDNNMTLYATAIDEIDSVWKVYISEDKGIVWDIMQPQPMYLDEGISLFNNHMTIEVSKAKTEYLYCNVKNYDSTNSIQHGAQLYYFDFSNGTNWVNFSNRYYETHGMGHGFGVDQTNNGEDVIVSNGIYMRMFSINAVGDTVLISQHHPDVEDILFHPYNDDEVWACTHGGVEKSTNNGEDWQTKYKGLSVANVEEMATSITNPELVMVGLYHDHTQLTQSSYCNNWIPDWFEAFDQGDGMRPLINNVDPNKMWASCQSGTWMYSNDKFTDNFQRYSLRTDFYTEGVLNKVTPLKMYRHGYIDYPDSKDQEIYITDTSGDNEVISLFHNIYSNRYYIMGLYTPYSNGNYLLVTIKDSLTGNYSLYRTTNVNDPSQNIQWTELEIPRTDGGISTIDFDPFDEDIVYIVYSNSSSTAEVSTKMVYWVDYSNPSDLYFHDISGNLPNTTTGKDCIEIDNTSTKGIYLYTSFGIFYTNNELMSSGSNFWQIYGTKLPHTRSGSLEINYVSNKLRAGLYGRGVWEIDIPCSTDLEDVLVDENDIWNAEISIGGTVTIEPQVELKIQNTVISFGPDAKIVVKPGAKLIIDNAVVTNKCINPWQGIQVWGNKAAHQFPDESGNYQQGYLKLINGATIDNAIIAVDLWEPYNWSSTGGIVYADDAIFRNNAKSIHALHYNNFHPNDTAQEMDYNSNFRYCIFEIAEDYFGGEIFHKHVDLAHVKGIDFQACNFSLASNVNNVSDFTHAIAGYDAKFRVSAICNSNQIPCPEEDYDRCTFTGFYSAVNAVNDGNSAVSFSVNRADFIKNAYGVRTLDMNNASVLFSNFEVDNAYGCGTGIYTNYVTGFAFEENEFRKHPFSTVSNYFGIEINNSEDVNEVYKNTFTDLSYANFSDGKNWYLHNIYEGLAYYCNNNSDNFADFFVADYIPNKRNSGIQASQGDENYTAANTFSSIGATWHFYNGGEHQVDYYRNPDYDNATPDLIRYVEVMYTGADSTCPSHYGGDLQLDLTLTTQQKIDAEQEYYNSFTDYNSTKTIYDNYIDGGNASGELLDIQTALPDDMWNLRAQLLGDSPHLSFEVLTESADKTDVFTEAALFEILAANPDELKKDTLISYLENKEEPLPDYMIALLQQLAGGTTYKTALQKQMAGYKHNYTRATHDIIRSIQNDTVTDYVELRNWLNNLGGITSDRQIISSFISESNFADAFTLANMLPSLYNLNADDFIEHQYYIDMLTLHQTLFQQNRNTFQLNSTEKADITYIANNSIGVAGSQAKSILEAVYNEYDHDCPDVQGTAGYKSNIITNPDVFGEIYGLNIKVKPNPAKQWAAFDYTLPDNENTGSITIRNVSGSIVKIIEISGKQGQKLWDTRNIVSGIYIYTINSVGYSQSGKIIISK